MAFLKEVDVVKAVETGEFKAVKYVDAAEMVEVIKAVAYLKQLT